MVTGKPGNWDLVLPMPEFAYNSAVHRITGKSPFMTVHGMPPCQPVDLVSIPHDSRPSEFASDFAKHMRELHAEVRQNIALCNENYKLAYVLNILPNTSQRNYMHEPLDLLAFLKSLEVMLTY